MRIVEKIEGSIFVMRDHRVMLVLDLAQLYGVEPRILVQAVKRNATRFPDDFLFRLTKEEESSLRSQFVILKKGRGQHSKYPLYAFTEQGVAMLSGVLNSPRAINVNIQIMRTFIKLRRAMVTHADMARKIEDLEKKYDGQFHVVFEAIRRLMEPTAPKKRRIGFITENRRKEVSHASR